MYVRLAVQMLWKSFKTMSVHGGVHEVLTTYHYWWGLKIEANSVLKSLQGLDHVTIVGGTLHIRSNLALTSLQGLHHFTTIGFNTLKALQGLDDFTTIGGACVINLTQP